MIVHQEENRLRCVTQTDHAALAAEILSLWRRDGLPESPRRDTLLRATREHDNGWQEIDSAPLVEVASGTPHDFLTLPSAERDELWERGTRRHLENDPYVALLIATHAIALHEDRRREVAWAAFLERMEARWLELLAVASVDEATIAADYRLLALADILSLALCGGWSASFQRAGYAARLESRTLLLEPFPLAGATTFQLSCRRIPRRRYLGDADLGVELATTRWERTPVRLAPFSQVPNAQSTHESRSSGSSTSDQGR